VVDQDIHCVVARRLRSGTVNAGTLPMAGLTRSTDSINIEHPRNRSVSLRTQIRRVEMVGPGGIHLNSALGPGTRAGTRTEAKRALKRGSPWWVKRCGEDAGRPGETARLRLNIPFSTTPAVPPPS
jgi:hypothetical protein